MILGKHAEEHKGLVCVSETDVLKHCVVIGQSGSGKSYFIARYLEELALRTKARIMVLDPNGDFTNFWKPRESTFWEHGAFAESLRFLNSSAKKQGIASYDKEENFVHAWKDVCFQFVLAGQTDRVPIKDGVYVAPLMLHWQYLGTEQDFLLNIDSVKFPKLQQGVVACYHFANDHSDEYFKNVSLRDLENIARDFADGKVAAADYPEASTLDEEDWLAVRLVFRRVRKRFWKLWYSKPLKGEVSIPTDLMGYINYGFRDEDRWQIGTVGLASSSVDDMLLSANAALYRLWAASFSAWEYAQRRTRQSFDLSAREADATSDGGEDEADVADLAEVPATETGSYVDARTPTIVVIDEAHNFAPAEPLSDLQERVSDELPRSRRRAENMSCFSFCLHNARRSYEKACCKNVRTLAYYGYSLRWKGSTRQMHLARLRTSLTR